MHGCRHKYNCSPHHRRKKTKSRGRVALPAKSTFQVPCLYTARDKRDIHCHAVARAWTLNNRHKSIEPQAMATRFALRAAKDGADSIPLPNICIGTWAWGDSMTWNNATEDARKKLDGAWQTIQEHDLNFIDTAEVYGRGESERIIKQLRDGTPDQFKQKLVIASKYLPIPVPPTKLWMPSGMVNSCRGSLQRLGLESMDLYQIHGPVHFLNSIDSMAGGLAKCVDLGLTRAVGVSNYSKDEMIKMDEALKKRGLRLASNQVEFSLLRTLPEKSGLLEECKKRGILLMAYSPL